MLDFRYETFLALCEIRNYTKTAEKMHITQPAVTQHIQYLENYYNCKLFEYKNRKITLTEHGERLKEFVTTISSDSVHFRDTILGSDFAETKINFGATLSIGEYVMPNILSALLNDKQNLNIHMTVGNTQVLLEKLDHGELDFILVEGVFDKTQYRSVLFSLERFIPVCAPNSAWIKKAVSFGEIASSQLILREKGSGTREILENILQEHNYKLGSFKHVIEIGNMAAIKKLVSNNIGITFLFEVAAQKELAEKSLQIIDILGFDVMREFNFVFLKNSFFEDEYMQYFDLMKKYADSL